MDTETKIYCSCIWTFFFLVFTFIVGSIIADLVIPPQKIAILDANLTRFELAASPTTSLSYNLSFTMSIHNSVWDDKADYHDMEVNCYYYSEQFDSRKLGDFMLKSRRTRLFNLSRSGNSSVDLGSNGVDAFKRSNETGFFDLEIWLKGKRIFEADEGDRHVHLYYQCKLRLQLMASQNSTTQGNFKPVKCH
ncbi:hypothetical protein LUZ61_012980 [Rhynchospora tenuis]|uniref:Late embryogenesis abundant protein LEA-2 subgroup domain-containing protein n=1 Tax=Rhynchospora tenuis TaxID=198213 RepID=A0AAD6A452_9POAL|nr:hypothetical protein LUZ61_012980 [Rhynchospora tenuis]